MRYSVRSGESPSIIARKFGMPLGSLVAANPHKATTVVAGVRTWRSLHAGETLNVPGTVGALGAIAPASPSAPHSLIKQGSTGPDVALWQTIIGVTADGIFGSGTDAATRKWQSAHGVAPDGVVGPNTWGAALGGAFPAAAAAIPAVATPIAATASLAAAAAAASAAIMADPNYCSSVARSGTPVNTAVHNFKAAWNAANPGQAVPINTGKYEPVVASALSSALGGIPAPPGCGAAPSVPPPPVPAPVQVSTVPTIIPTSIPTAVQALVSIDPCYSGNAAMVCAAQAALGLPADGKYGANTANALRRFLPSAPAPCSPAPLWWGKATDNKCGGASLQPPVFTPPSTPATTTSAGWQATPPSLPVQPIIEATPPPPGPGVSPVTATSTTTVTPVGPSQPTVAAPEQKGLSTGALVAGGLGVAALVGVVALAATGKKSARSAPHKRPSKKTKKRK